MQALRKLSEQGGGAIDGDTSVGEPSWNAALHAAGAAMGAVDCVLEGRNNNAFVAARPPGHHAESGRSMGFCLFNNVAIAARHAQAKHGVKRVAILDWDVHHGNGTQEIFWSDPDLFYGSTHQMPLYPGSGGASETGVGNIFNAPLKAGDGGLEFRSAMQNIILPALETFSPDLVIISAGFDAHARDPLGSLQLTEEDFAWATVRLMEVADMTASGRVVSVLEGGYDLQALAGSVGVHVHALMHGQAALPETEEDDADAYDDSED